MTRDRKAIKKEITDSFMEKITIQTLYGFLPGLVFENIFSLISLENIIFDIMSFVIHTHEQIVSKNALNSRPQNLPNFRQSIFDFLDGLELVWLDGSFSFDTSNVTDVEDRKIIDRCSVLESDDGELVVKIATENAGELQPLTLAQYNRVFNYIKQIKVPGVKIRLINQLADELKTNLTVYVDPAIIDLIDGKLLNTSEETYPVQEGIKQYLSELEFNGAFVTDHFRETIKNKTGIKLCVVNLIQWKFGAFPYVDVMEWKIAESGYFKIQESDLTITYLPYALVNN